MDKAAEDPSLKSNANGTSADASRLRTNRIMFTKAGIVELHAAMHERLDLLLGHIATVPEELHHSPISGFGHSSIWKQLVHILTCEEGWVHDLRNQPFPGWCEEDCPTMAALRTAKARIREATRTYLGDLNEEQLNTTLTQRPVDWGGQHRLMPVPAQSLPRN